ncbi:MAG: NAD-dependent epimerase/dehydratase family protein [Candidatus Hydrogenedentes bacterium]|nr:NAD-dependent epimerase/dehydratase family protein [Candidatus Hydrogenedentota bacterium]
MNILIVGGTRFLGAAISRELVRGGHSVTALHRGHSQWNVPVELKHVLGDARDRDQVSALLLENRFDAVVDTILSAADLEWYLPLAHRYAGQLAHCGSTGVYAPLSIVPAREDDPTPCPPEFGGFGEKLEQDRVLMAFHEKTGFKTCSLRVSNIFGAGDVPLDGWGARNPKYFQRVADGAAIWIPDHGLSLLQPVHTDDLARGFHAALLTDKTAGQIYNLSSERAVTLTLYAQLTMELLGSKSPVKYVPMEEILALRKTDEGGLRFLVEHMCIDWSKAREELGYVPRVTVREGLRESLRWMCGSGLLNGVVRD